MAEQSNRPVEKVSWDDIQVFLTRLNAQEAGNIPAGWAYVLPTEAQWEYACRAGTTTRVLVGRCKLLPTMRDANSQDSGYAQSLWMWANTMPTPGAFFDMHGNVWERGLRDYDVCRSYSKVSAAVTDPEGAD